MEYQRAMKTWHHKMDYCSAVKIRPINLHYHEHITEATQNQSGSLQNGTVQHHLHTFLVSGKILRICYECTLM